MPSREYGTINGPVGSFYKADNPQLNDDVKAVLIEYSGIPESQLVPHVREVRDKAWAIRKYPCIGKYFFLDFGISESPNYPEIVKRLKDGQQFLDLGCCFGQDVRKLVYDGVPPENLHGSDLELSLIDCGFDLFQDREKLKSTFTTADFFAENIGLQGGSFDIIHAASFFHLFNWDEQVETMSRAIRLLKQRPGSMLIGHQAGFAEPRSFKHAAARSGELYRHNSASFERLVKDVEKVTGKSLAVDATAGRHDEWRPDENLEIVLLRFTVTIQ